VIERSSNTIDDLFTGVTLSLFAAEQGTTISLDIEQDLSQVKTEIVGFVEAYNGFRQFYNLQRLRDETTGELSEEAGVLSKSLALAQVASSLSQILGSGVAGVDPSYTVLSQVGVNFVDLNQEDPLLAENLEIDEALLDSVLLSNPEDVRKLFNFSYTSSDPRITLLNFDGDTEYSQTGYTLNVQPGSGTNMFRYSEELDNAAWAPFETTVNADVETTTAPDGTYTADTLVANASTNFHSISTSAQETITNGQAYIYSTYVKAGGKSDVGLQLYGTGFGGSHKVQFDLATGTVRATTGTVDASSIEDVGDGWYRVSMKVTATADGFGHFERYSEIPAGPVYLGDGVTEELYWY